MTRREIIALSLAFLITLPAVTSRLYASDEVQVLRLAALARVRPRRRFRERVPVFLRRGRLSQPGVSRDISRTPDALGPAHEFHDARVGAALGALLRRRPSGGAGHGAPADGYSRPYIVAVSLGSAVYGFLAVLLSAAAARRVIGRGLAASLIVAAGTPLVFYSYVAPVFGHATSAFAVSLMVWVWLRVRDRWTLRGALALGLAGGLVAIVREQDALLALGPALDFVWFAWQRLRERPAATGTPAAWCKPRSPAWPASCSSFCRRRWRMRQSTAASGRMRPSRESSHGRRRMPSAWCSAPKHGLLAWTPLVAVALIGLVLLATNRVARPEAQRVGALLVLMCLAQIYTSGIVESWTVAGSFGQRRFVALTPVLTIGVAAILAVTTHVWVRRTVMTLLVLCVWWNMGLMVQFGMNRMDRQKLTLARNARLTFVEIPLEAPGIAWNYLTNRSSFYKRPRQ